MRRLFLKSSETRKAGDKYVLAFPLQSIKALNSGWMSIVRVVGMREKDFLRVVIEKSFSRLHVIGVGRGHIEGLVGSSPGIEVNTLTKLFQDFRHYRVLSLSLALGSRVWKAPQLSRSPALIPAALRREFAP